MELMHRTFKRCRQNVLFLKVEFTADIHPIFQILLGPHLRKTSNVWTKSSIELRNWSSNFGNWVMKTDCINWN